jgi:hypothetical protein
MVVPTLSWLIATTSDLLVKKPSVPTLVDLISASDNVIRSTTLDDLEMCKPSGLEVTSWSPLTQREIHGIVDGVMAKCYEGVLTAAYTERGDIGQLPIATYESDCEQLMFDRISAYNGAGAPPCIFHASGACVTTSLPCEILEYATQSIGKACSYLTPEQERVFQTTGHALSGPCLMCIRRMWTRRALQRHDAVTPQNADRNAKMTPPFTNLYNCKGGYKREAILESPLMVGAIVKMDTHVSVVYYRESRRMGVDQRDLMWVPDGELCQQPSN